MPIIFDTGNCIVCKACVLHCPQEAISFSDNILRRNSQLCTECGKCIDVCTTGKGSAFVDTPIDNDIVETTTITCDICGGEIGSVKHLKWLIGRLQNRLPENLYNVHLRLEELPGSAILCSKCRQGI